VAHKTTVTLILQVCQQSNCFLW